MEYKKDKWEVARPELLDCWMAEAVEELIAALRAAVTEAFVRLQPRRLHYSHAWQSQFLFLNKNKSGRVNKE